MRLLLPLLATVFLSSACAAQEPGREREARGRLAPPAAVNCDRNHLTSYQGAVASVVRDNGELKITLVTDWDSEESFTVDEDAPQLYGGAPLEAPRQAMLLDTLAPPYEGLGVIAWVCREPASVTLDWRPRVTDREGTN